MVSVGPAAAHRHQGLQIEFSGNVHRVRRRQVPDGRRVSHLFLLHSSFELFLTLSRAGRSAINITRQGRLQEPPKSSPKL